MPNFDGGHYFLTVLAPIRTDILVAEAGLTCSPTGALYQVLATLPTALQSPPTERIGLNSPFARNRRTHFARFAVIPDVIFNGRNPVNAVRVAIAGPNPVIAQPVDQLSCPFLLFVADFDAASGAEAELRSYLDELWQTMQEELKDVFKSCIGFAGVTDSVAFQDYILRCQVETTMPFNDYWVDRPPLVSLERVLLGLLGVPLLIALVSLVLWLVDAGGWPWGSIAAVACLAFGIAIVAAYWLVMRHGAKPFPAAPNADLPSVLKALYLQQKTVRFAIDMQGADPRRLYDAFGRFVAEHRPSDLQHPTQPPGVVRS